MHGSSYLFRNKGTISILAAYGCVIAFKSLESYTELRLLSVFNNVLTDSSLLSSLREELWLSFLC